MFPLLTSAKLICLLFHLTYVNSNWIDAQKSKSRKKGGVLYAGVEVQLTPQSLKIYQTELPFFIEVRVFRMRLNLNKVLPVMHELKWAQMNQNELKRVLKKSKWAQISLKELK